MTIHPKKVEARESCSELKMVFIQRLLEEYEHYDQDMADSGMTDPRITEYDKADPGMADPGITEYDNADPGMADPGMANPGMADPGIADLGVADPGIADLGMADLGVANPGIADLGMADPEMSDPGIADPGVDDPRMADPGMVDQSAAGRNNEAPSLPPRHWCTQPAACRSPYKVRFFIDPRNAAEEGAHQSFMGVEQACDCRDTRQFGSTDVAVATQGVQHHHKQTEDQLGVQHHHKQTEDQLALGLPPTSDCPSGTRLNDTSSKPSNKFGIRAHTAYILTGRQSRTYNSQQRLPPGPRSKSSTDRLTDNTDSISSSTLKANTRNVQLGSALQRVRRESLVRRIQRLSERDHGRIMRDRIVDPGEMKQDRVRRGSDVIANDALVRERKAKARARFRWCIRMVNNIMHIMRVVIKLSHDQTVRTAVEMQWHTLNTSKEARKLAFNPSYYAKSKAYSRLPKWAKIIMAKDPSARTDQDCRRLHALLRGLKSFDKFTERIQLAMCKAFTYQHVDTQRVILRKGHVGQNFYFLYSGSVFVNVEDINAQGEKFVKTEVVLSKGDSFGELALLKDITRTATITCREPCEMLVVHKEVFAKVCPRIFDRELEEKVNFLSQLPLFHSKYWSHEALHNLCFESQIQEYKTSKVVVPESRTEEWMYICMEGLCRVIKCLTLDGSTDEEPSDSLLREDEMITAEFLDSMQQAPSKREGTSTRHSHHSSRSRKSTSESLSQHRTLMLKSLTMDTGLQSANEPQELPQELHKEPSLQALKVKARKIEEKDMLDKKDGEENGSDEHHQRAQQGVITLSMLMKQKKADCHKEFIYLDIGTLNPKQVFDLAEVLQPSKTHDSSCLILVSSGARLLRIKKQTFHTCLSQEGMDHAKHIAIKQLYPSSSVLLKSYKTKSRWDRYKQKILQEVMTPHLLKAKRRDILVKVKAMKTLNERQDDRLLNTLKKAQILNPNESELDPDTVLSLKVPYHPRNRRETYDAVCSKDRDKHKNEKFELPVVMTGPLMARRKSSLSVVAMSPKSSLVDINSVATAIIPEAMEEIGDEEGDGETQL